jgi:thiosulfate/3-mercaptopyruvate sulfurtransferase
MAHCRGLFFLISWFFIPCVVVSQEVFLSVSGFLEQSLKFETLDVRKKGAFEKAHLRGAKWVNVGLLDDPESIRGSLLREVGGLERVLGSLGVDGKNPILIMGDSILGWGEDGRLFWLLERYHGGDVFILDGGFRALERVIPKSRLTKGPARSMRPGKIRLKLKSPLFSFRSLNETTGSTLLDVRSTLEYAGATPFGSSFGGHLTGARSLPWGRFFDHLGFLSINQKQELLAKVGVKKPVLYCTAGYRSALVYAVLLHWGLSPRNYDGSWYEYSSRMAKPGHALPDQDKNEDL